MININLKPLQEQQLVGDGGAEVVDVLLPCINLSLLLDACRLFTGKTKTYKSKKGRLADLHPTPVSPLYGTADLQMWMGLYPMLTPGSFARFYGGRGPVSWLKFPF